MARKVRLAAEQLDRRDIPAVFGVPWMDPTHITLSFAPDGTGIGAVGSNLDSSLGSLSAVSAFENVILQAVRTWSSHANISLGVVADSGNPFGRPARRNTIPALAISASVASRWHPPHLPLPFHPTLSSQEHGPGTSSSTRTSTGRRLGATSSGWRSTRWGMLWDSTRTPTPSR